MKLNKEKLRKLINMLLDGESIDKTAEGVHCARSTVQEYRKIINALVAGGSLPPKINPYSPRIQRIKVIIQEIQQSQPYNTSRNHPSPTTNPHNNNLGMSMLSDLQKIENRNIALERENTELRDKLNKAEAKEKESTEENNLKIEQNYQQKQQIKKLEEKIIILGNEGNNKDQEKSKLKQEYEEKIKKHIQDITALQELFTHFKNDTEKEKDISKRKIIQLEQDLQKTKEELQKHLSKPQNSLSPSTPQQFAYTVHNDTDDSHSLVDWPYIAVRSGMVSLHTIFDSINTSHKKIPTLLNPQPIIVLSTAGQSAPPQPVLPKKKTSLEHTEK